MAGDPRVEALVSDEVLSDYRRDGAVEGVGTVSVTIAEGE